MCKGATLIVAGALFVAYVALATGVPVFVCPRLEEVACFFLEMVIMGFLGYAGVILWFAWRAYRSKRVNSHRRIIRRVPCQPTQRADGPPQYETLEMDARHLSGAMSVPINEE